MVQRIRIQHYVPRFYLRKFATKKGNKYLINCFDKPTEKMFKVVIRKIACEHNFYDTVQDTNQFIEKTLGRFEAQFNSVIDKLLRTKNLNALKNAEIVVLAYFIATQWIRTKEDRETIRDLIKQLNEILLQYKLSEKLENQVREANTEETIRSLHLRKLSRVPEFVDIMLNMKWILFINRTGIPLWTSDHPVTLYNPVDMSPYGNLGILCKGIQLYFPLSQKVSLALCDPVLYQLLPKKWIYYEKEAVVFQNSLQVRWSTRQVFSSDQDFSLAEKMITDHPELKDVNRKRVDMRQ